MKSKRISLEGLIAHVCEKRNVCGMRDSVIEGAVVEDFR